MIALVELLDEHEDAIAYDLITLGLRVRDLGTEDLTWGDLRAIATQAPRSSALFRAMNPEEAEWGLAEQLLALQVDMTRVLAWQNSNGKQKDYPKPISRPGITDDSDKIAGDAVSYEEMTDWLGW